MPVHSVPRWVLLDPTVDLIDCCLRVQLVTCQKESFCEPGEMLMPVEFMNDFGVGRRSIDKVVVCPIPSWPIESVNRVAMPINVCTEMNIAVGQKIHAMFAQNICILNCAAEPIEMLNVEI